MLAVAFVLLAGSAFVLESLHYGHGPLLIVRGIVLAIVAAMAIVLVVVPLLPVRRPSDRRVALYFEEHAPSLDAAVLTAVELQELDVAGAKAPSAEAARGRRPVSSTLLGHLTRTALERVHTIDDGRHVDERDLHVSAGILAGVVGVALLVTLFGPPISSRHGRCSYPGIASPRPRCMRSAPSPGMSLSPAAATCSSARGSAASSPTRSICSLGSATRPRGSG